MKKIFYLLAFVAIAFASCDPLSKTYSTIDATPTPYTKTLTITLANADYQKLGTSSSSPYPGKSYNFKTTADANLYIPTILNAEYPQLDNGSNANVTFAFPATQPLVPDSTYTHVAYTMVTADYTFPGNTFPDLSAAGVLNYLAYKYPTPVPNQLVVLTYVFFESGGTPSAGTTVTDSFMFLGGAWTKIYTVSPAQYASVNRGTNNWFIATDIPNIPVYLNTFLTSDPLVIATNPKVGDVKYISYRYLTTFQKVISLIFDGTNWVNKQTLSFLKSGGTWIPDPTVYYTFNKADYAVLNLASTTAGTAAARANVASFGDFNIQSAGSATYWSPADLQAALIVMLTADFPSPKPNIPYKVTYAVYTGVVSNVSAIFVYNGTTWVAQ